MALLSFDEKNCAYIHVGADEYDDIITVQYYSDWYIKVLLYGQ
jgi:hypothetical protein